MMDFTALANSEPGWYFLQPHTHGDTYLMCALMEAFKRQYSAWHGRPQHVTVVIKESYRTIGEMFPAIDRIVTVPDGDIMQIALRNPSRIVAPNTPVVLHPHFLYAGNLDALTVVEGFSDKDMFAHLLGLPIGTPLALPVIAPVWRDCARACAEEIGLVPGRSVILFPDGSYHSPDTRVWGGISQMLAQKGWKVFTNTYGNNSGPRLVPFIGSDAIAPPLEVLLPLCEMAGWVVSTLTGGLAILYMAQIKCKKTVITVGPKHGEVLSFNPQIQLRHAYPFGSQRKCDGLDYEAQEVEYTGIEDCERVIDEVVHSYYADFDSPCPNALPVVPLSVPVSPGDLFDRISVLQIKSERITDPKALHYVKRELLHLEAIVCKQGWVGTADTIIYQLKKENEIGWEGIDYIYRNLDVVLEDVNHERCYAYELCEKYAELRDSNKRRVALKRKADELFGSIFSEQKTY